MLQDLVAEGYLVDSKSSQSKDAERQERTWQTTMERHSRDDFAFWTELRGYYRITPNE